MTISSNSAQCGILRSPRPTVSPVPPPAVSPAPPPRPAPPVPLAVAVADDHGPAVSPALPPRPAPPVPLAVAVADDRGPAVPPCRLARLLRLLPQPPPSLTRSSSGDGGSGHRGEQRINGAGDGVRGGGGRRGRGAPFTDVARAAGGGAVGAGAGAIWASILMRKGWRPWRSRGKEEEEAMEVVGEIRRGTGGHDGGPRCRPHLPTP
ncbi:proline-rich receptor-like protein kinase PERK2 [Triticum dicoccoides]|uniref:proline-rich receptor-like protein kinase PERK2 n=1 Tax=Triticum dicoccoides TaxID=85692 RepID=UPI001891A3A2|nr:proline-rich receptor-like protein kinase PERK2 [Triticum dicoccoides]